MVGNSDVWGMQCFCFLNWFLSMPNGHAQKPFRNNTAYPIHANYLPLIHYLTSSHLLCKKGDHLSKVDGSWSLTDEVISLCICDWSSNIHKGSFEVVGSDDAILVDINDTKCFLEFLDLLLTEQGEDVRSGLLGLLGSFSGLKKEKKNYIQKYLSTR